MVESQREVLNNMFPFEYMHQGRLKRLELPRKRGTRVLKKPSTVWVIDTRVPELREEALKMNGITQILQNGGGKKTLH